MKEKRKKKKGIARLFEIAGERKGLLILAGILSAGSALCMLVPYWSIYCVLQELLEHAGNLAQIDSELLIYWGWFAFFGLIGGLLLLYAALMASHVAAFRIPLRFAHQIVGTHRTAVIGIPEQHVHRKHQKDYGTECRKDRKLHRTYHS